MSYKVIRNIGVVLLALYVLGIAGAVIFWFSHYYVMQEGYFGFGDSLMIACCICGVIALIGQLGVPVIIISFVVKGQQTKRKALNTQAVAPQNVQHDVQCVIPQSMQNTASEQAEKSYCSMCGAEHSAQAHFCPYCGNKLS